MIGVDRRRVMGGGGGTPLPYDAEIEYLESTGTQYIQLSFGFDPTDEVNTSFAILSNGQDKYIVSPRTWNDSNNRFGMGVTYAFGAAFGDVSTNLGNLLPSTQNDRRIHEWIYSNKVFSIPELNIERDYSTAGFGNTTTDLKLFYGFGSNINGRLRSYHHKKGGMSVCDLIAVRIGQVGYMYDRVSGQLFGNSGTGDFVLGADKN